MDVQEAERKIKTNLFIISVNNSGSTFLSKVISRCSKVASLEIEGQHLPCWAGPSIPKVGLNLIWAAPVFNYLKILQNPENYDWQKIKKCWYSNILTNSEDFNVFLEKSPPHLARIKMLENNFYNPKFIFLIRNPYAVAESIMRYRRDVKKEHILDIAAAHIISCFQMQKDNYEKYPQSLKITYEEMCDNYQETQKKIIQYIPELADIDLNQKLLVKKYNEQLRNMNEEQISRLSAEQIEKLTNIFKQHKELLNYFGYELIDLSSGK